jgi:ligand-binding sensor domain-containing protein
MSPACPALITFSPAGPEAAGAWDRTAVTSMVEKWVGDSLETQFGRALSWKEKEITAACRDLDGNLIVGTQGAGVWWYGPDRKATQVEGLSGNFVLALHIDQAGALWVGLDPGGLNRVQRQLFHPLDASTNLTVHSVCEDGQGRLWFSSTGRGIDYWKDDILKNTDSPIWIPSASSTPAALLVDRDQNIWAATSGQRPFPLGRRDQFQPAQGNE